MLLHHNYTIQLTAYLHDALHAVHLQPAPIHGEAVQRGGVLAARLPHLLFIVLCHQTAAEEGVNKAVHGVVRAHR